MFDSHALYALGFTDFEEVIYNPSYETLFREELTPHPHPLHQGIETVSGAVAVDTGRFTGRSPKDKYIVSHPDSDQHLWRGQGSDNQPLSIDAWQYLKQVSLSQLNGKKLFVIDGYCGANSDSRLKVRLITEVAWMAHFFKNMFIRPDADELKDFEPDWTILNACDAEAADYGKYGMRSKVFVAFNIQERMTCIGGTWYSGEIKKGVFTMMHYFLPLKDIAVLHCSANQGKEGDVALFFGLSGTGKTTLSADPERLLIGDDEHGWDGDGIFNFEGGCYAKTLGLSEEKEPDIFRAIRADALLENVDVNEDTGEVNYASSAKTENARVSYPLYHIDNIVTPVSRGDHPQNIIFLTCDAFGVFPPISKLSNEQAMYHYLSGYTAKVAGTELGVEEPQATFSACFGQPFLTHHPIVYADLLAKKIETHQVHVWLLNTGWYQGRFGVGSRLPLKINRTCVNNIVKGTLIDVTFDTMPVFGFQVPQYISGVDAQLLHPRNTWEDKNAYDTQLEDLAKMFIENFKKFHRHHLYEKLVAVGPHV